MKNSIGRIWSKLKAAIDDERAADERLAIAKAFNNRYCYRVQYESDAPRLGGTARFGIFPRGGNRWMCPECNHIHAPTECSVWDGLHYPACCKTSAGNRLDYGIRIS